MKVRAPQVSPHRNGHAGQDRDRIDGDHPPQNAFDEATNVMESGLLRTLTDKSARESAQGDADVVAEAPAATKATEEHEAPPPERQTSQTEAQQATTQSVAPPRHRSRMFAIAGTVAAIVLTFDAWLITHHRQRTTPSAAASSEPSQALPSYMLLPLGTSPPREPAQSKVPAAAPANPAVVEEAAPAIVEPTAHRHRHGHHRH